MRPIGDSETSVRNWNYSLRNNPEERSYHTLHVCTGENQYTAVVPLSGSLRFVSRNPLSPWAQPEIIQNNAHLIK